MSEKQTFEFLPEKYEKRKTTEITSSFEAGPKRPGRAEKTIEELPKKKRSPKLRPFAISPDGRFCGKIAFCFAKDKYHA